jgi:hypothetical protein
VNGEIGGARKLGLAARLGARKPAQRVQVNVVDTNLKHNNSKKHHGVVKIKHKNETKALAEQ